MSTRRSARLSAAAANGNPSPAPPPPPPPSAAPAPKKTGRKRKALSGDAPAPATPNKRRAKAPAATTPTPSNAKLIAEPANTTTAAAVTPKPKVRRLADLNRTNAPLLSPETSRVVRARPAVAEEGVSPSRAPPTAAAPDILEEACAHLIGVDARMKPLIDAHPCRMFSPEGLAQQIDPFESLCSGVISQQVSGAAAKAIKKRFVELFFPPPPPPPPGNESEVKEEEEEEDDDDDDDGDAGTGTESNFRRFPHPSQVAACPIDRLRTAGLSQRKAEYVQGLAEHFVSGELSAQMLADAPYEEVLEKLIAVRGLGRWSVEMFACFALKRLDVFSLGDLGVQRGMAAFVGRDVAKLKAKGGKWKYMSEQEMREISERFAPYRSLFMWYMWRVEQTDVSTME